MPYWRFGALNALLVCRVSRIEWRGAAGEGREKARNKGSGAEKSDIKREGSRRTGGRRKEVKTGLGWGRRTGRLGQREWGDGVAVVAVVGGCKSNALSRGDLVTWPISAPPFCQCYPKSYHFSIQLRGPSTPPVPRCGGFFSLSLFSPAP